ncbi:MAG TPA: hypothetical protein VOA80_24900 [Thermoanaerobaculia bacterium]|nr:hypothetical protein [Thermoanaerobaculia bacterium]
MSNGLEISRVEASDDGTNLKVNIEVRNTSARTLHAYATVRGMQYDSIKQVLRLLLRDREVASATGATQVHPRFAAVDPHETTVIPVTIPRELTQIDLNQKGPSPVLVRQPIHEAVTVEVEVSWSDVPFHVDPRSKAKSMREQLVAWEKDVALGRSKRSKKTIR